MGISIWQLLIVLGIVILIFGTKKLRNMGRDVGGAVKGFKSAMKENPDDMKKTIEEDDGNVIDAEVEIREKDKDKV